MSNMLDLITDLSPFRSGIVCDGLDKLTNRLLEELPFTVHEFASGIEHNGWVVPWSWNVQKATIHDDQGRLIWDGNDHPLGVISYSEAFTGEVDGATLKQHCYFHSGEDYEDELVYHCQYWLQPHARTWGFSVPRRLYDWIDSTARFHVALEATFTPGSMKVAEHVLPGETSESIVLLAHDCHAGTANDDLSGIAVGIEVMRRLAMLQSRRYTYRLLVSPEHAGPIFWLQRFGSDHLRYALFLESLGTTGPLALQQSFTGKSKIDMALTNALRGRKHYTAGFREIVGNCETTLEAQGIAVPCPSLSRCPFEEYHSSRDNPGLMSEEHLAESAEVVYEAMMALDRDASPRSEVRGLICLSNPKYDLYFSYFDPSIPGRRTIPDEAKNLNRMMNHLPRYLDGKHTVLELAERFGLRFPDMLNYLENWQQKGLASLSHDNLPVVSGTTA